MTPPTRRRPAGSRGSAPLELVLAVGLLLVPLACLVLVLPTWVERQSMARLAAREAARTVALAASWDAGAQAAADAARRIAGAHGVTPEEIDVALGGNLEPGASVVATVTVTMPAVVVPGVASLGAWSWSTAHAEPVDTYRSWP